MRKLTVLGLCVALLLVASAAHAISIGSIQPEAGRAAIGGDIAFGTRDIQREDNNGFSGDLDFVTYLADLNYGVTDQFEVYLMLGGASADLEAKTGGSRTYDGGASFAWGGGVRGVLYDDGEWFIKGQGGYLAHNDLDLDRAGLNRGEFDYSEWQIALLGGMHFDDMIDLYAGIQYSDVTINVAPGTGINNVTDPQIVRADGVAPDWEADDNFGISVGADVEIQRDLYVNVEGHFVDQTSGSVGLTYRFF